MYWYVLEYGDRYIYMYMMILIYPCMYEETYTYMLYIWYDIVLYGFDISYYRKLLHGKYLSCCVDVRLLRSYADIFSNWPCFSREF